MGGICKEALGNNRGSSVLLFIAGWRVHQAKILCKRAAVRTVLDTLVPVLQSTRPPLVTINTPLFTLSRTRMTSKCGELQRQAIQEQTVDLVVVIMFGAL